MAEVCSLEDIYRDRVSHHEQEDPFNPIPPKARYARGMNHIANVAGIPTREISTLVDHRCDFSRLVYWSKDFQHGSLETMSAESQAKLMKVINCLYYQYGPLKRPAGPHLFGETESWLLDSNYKILGLTTDQLNQFFHEHADTVNMDTDLASLFQRFFLPIPDLYVLQERHQISTCEQLELHQVALSQQRLEGVNPQLQLLLADLVHCREDGGCEYGAMDWSVHDTFKGLVKYFSR